jgi:hypothetical protein
MRINSLGSKLEEFLLPESGTIQELRERILRVITIFIVLIGTPMLIANVPNFIELNNFFGL